MNRWTNWVPPEFDLDQTRDRDHGPVRPADVQLADVLRLQPELRLGLELHPVGPAVQVEVVDVQRRKHGLQGREDLRQRHSQRLYLFPVYVDVDLGHIHPHERLHPLQLRLGVGLLGKLIDQPGEFPNVVDAPVLQIDFQACRRSQAGDLRQIEAECNGVLEPEEEHVGPRQHGVELLLFWSLSRAFSTNIEAEWSDGAQDEAQSEK